MVSNAQGVTPSAGPELSPRLLLALLVLLVLLLVLLLLLLLLLRPSSLPILASRSQSCIDLL